MTKRKKIWCMTFNISDGINKFSLPLFHSLFFSNYIQMILNLCSTALLHSFCKRRKININKNEYKKALSIRCPCSNFIKFKEVKMRVKFSTRINAFMSLSRLWIMSGAFIALPLPSSPYNSLLKCTWKLWVFLSSSFYHVATRSSSSSSSHVANFLRYCKHLFHFHLLTYRIPMMMTWKKFFRYLQNSVLFVAYCAP